jgi:hypothetical protein
LWVGQDLDGSAEHVELRRHLRECPECAEHWGRMKNTMNVLQVVKEDPQHTPHKSIWPAVTRRIARAERSPRMGRFNGWIPAAAVAAACLVLIIFSNNASRNYPSRNYLRSEIPAGMQPISTGLEAPRLDDQLKRLFPGELEEFYPDPSWQNRPQLDEDALRKQRYSPLRNVIDGKF